MINAEGPASTALEEIPDGEAARIENTVRLTIERLKERYVENPPIRRGVHPKDHGCVTAKFTVLDSLPKHLQVGLFSRPGQQYDAFVRFSNADVDPKKPDSAVLKDGAVAHGSRGMAVKVLGVTGKPLQATNLMTTNGPLNQDFLMINQPVFAFANVVDYEALSQILLDHKDDVFPFFARTKSADEEVKSRAKRTAGIIERIRSNEFPAATGIPAFQAPPASPLDNRYFSAAAFLFGEGRAMKFGARPVSPVLDKVTDMGDENYLATALQKRLAARGNIKFDFQVQVRSADTLSGKIATEIEDVCVEWPEGKGEGKYPFETVARISIPPQDIDSPERKALCEDLFFSPWNGLAEHRPLGGINRLRLAVYEASVQTRHVPAACPMDAGRERHRR